MTKTFQDGSHVVPIGNRKLLRLVATAAKASERADTQVPADGALVAVGGSAKRGIFADILQLYGRPAPKILIIPHALPAKSRRAVVEANYKLFAAAGANAIETLDLSQRGHAKAQIAHADIIWMSGGRQKRLAGALRQAGLIEDMRQRFAAGRGIIAGTSAGASILSDTMIETSRRDAAGTSHPILSRGLGLWHDAIIDQHFSERGRLERLSRAVERHPKLIGIGVDENTGFVRFRDGKARVIGRGTVTILRAVSNEAGLEAIEAPHLHLDQTVKPR